VLVALTFPLIRRAIRRWSSSRARLAVLLSLPTLLLVCGLAYNVVTINLTNQDPTNWSVWFAPMSRAASFAVGMYLAVASAHGVRLPTVQRRLVASLGIASLLALVVTRPESNVLHWWPTLYATALGVALAAVVLHRGPYASVLTEPTLAWLGALGYGIYLIHEPVLRVATAWDIVPAAAPGPGFLATAVVVAVPSVVLAWLSSRTVEAAGLRLSTLVARDGTPRDFYPHLAAEPA
jgi:peptidoglycan/LPS O-acetylase OafA/YrhL